MKSYVGYVVHLTPVTYLTEYLTLAPLTTLLVVKECVRHLGYKHPGHPVLPSLDPRPL